MTSSRGGGGVLLLALAPVATARVTWVVLAGGILRWTWTRGVYQEQTEFGGERFATDMNALTGLSQISSERRGEKRACPVPGWEAPRGWCRPQPYITTP